MNARNSSRLAALWLFAALAAGCGGNSDDFMDERLAMLEKLVPASGTVKVGGKPLKGVVVTFLPKEWTSSVGETDDEGRFELMTASRPGGLPGEYKVALSYLVSADGRVLGASSRGGMVPDPAIATAVENIPPNFSSLDKTTLSAVIPPEGSTNLTFEVDVQVEPAKPKAEPKEESEKPAEAPQN
ncbi:carboxypeptidase regulatory-like domain-containing protein [Paludisphaera rhizosphaerae]|uniref:carboxypeptidase regulatory-like domain-containing protein n=1 Tax=Paludisphaera rhizosphaerae TaxID=2711216 RepID=UPI0013EABF32|nr:carboxypeptidase regulatory-like domain-containing protein [Paludisphaera rhizosphaerae]